TKVIFALSLGVTGIFGCASNDRLYHRTELPGVPQPPTKSATEISSNSAPIAPQPQAAAPRASETPSTPPRNPLAQIRDAESAGKSDNIEEKSAPPAKPPVQ